MLLYNLYLNNMFLCISANIPHSLISSQTAVHNVLPTHNKAAHTGWRKRKVCLKILEYLLKIFLLLTLKRVGSSD